MMSFVAVVSSCFTLYVPQKCKVVVFFSVLFCFLKCHLYRSSTVAAGNKDAETNVADKR